MVPTPDNLPAYVLSHSSTTLLLHTTLPFSNNPIPILVNSGATDNFIDESMVFSILVNSGTSGTFISSQLDLQCNNLDKLLKLQLFDGSPAITGITQYYNNTLTLNNNLQFQAQLLVTQLPPPPWLQDINPNINWKNLI
ncbi:hypothetical protein E4T56_gene1699 [Termitomyces sp. T112]|nr:hypothetical protein E4T56_gene1699 [Termitomyces sp. T112]